MNKLYKIIKEEVDKFLKEWGSENKLSKVKNAKSSLGGDIYTMEIAYDSFIHLTDIETANSIVKNEKIPTKGGVCSAISTTFGEMSPNKSDIAIFFTTLDLPKGENSAHDVTWDSEVECSSVRTVPLDVAFNLIKSSKESLPDKISDFVVYDSKYLEESN